VTDAPTESLTPERITSLLAERGHEAKVVGFTHTRVGTGQMGANYRLDLEFEGDRGDVPPSLVAKTSFGPPERRRIAAGSYRTEITFYRDLSLRVAARVPGFWGAWTNEDCTDFVLLLEDLAPREQGDQIDGCTVEQATLAAQNLAGLHGPLWSDPWLTEHLAPFDERQGADLDSVFPAMIDMFLGRFGHRISPQTAAVYEELRDVLGSWFANRMEPFGLVHGDYRLDNLLFAPDGSDVAAVDWQTVSLGLPTRDLAYLCGTGLSVEDRRAADDDIVAAYHERLVGYGVDDYDLATCRTDYAYGMLQCPMVVAFGSAVAEVTERGEQMFTAMAERSSAAIRDLGTLDLLR
jgi:hypothetical protein